MVRGSTAVARPWLRLAGAMVVLLPVLVGCGYRVTGKGDVLPKTMRSIAIQEFGNPTVRYRLNDRLPAAIGREFLSRTRYRVIPDAGKADAVLSGGITNYFAFPTVFDQGTGRAAAVQVTILMNIQLIERETGKVLYTRQGLELRQRYEISSDQLAYFEESDMALERLSRDVARLVVSSVLEAF